MTQSSARTSQLLTRHTQRRKAVFQTGHTFKLKLRKLLFVLAGLLAAHTLAMIWLENLSLHEAIWLTFTTLTTVGYGDLSAQTKAGQVATILLMYVTGITLLTLIVSDYIDYRFYKRESIRTGRWRWNMINHILLINSPVHGGVQYYIRLVKQIRANEDYQSTPIQILTRRYPDGLPPELTELGVVHFHGSGNSNKDLSAVNVNDARHIIVLAPDASNPDSDSATFDVLHRLMEFNLSKHSIVECVQDENRERFEKLGPKTILRPVRTYPEIIVRAMLTPGAEKVLEDLFTHENDHPHRYDIKIIGLAWSDVVCALIQADLGTAMAYVEPTGEIVCQPRAHEIIDAKALIVLVKTEYTPAAEDLETALAVYRQRLQHIEEILHPTHPESENAESDDTKKKEDSEV